MRATLYGLLEELAHVGLPPGPVVELGAGRAEGQRHLPSVADSLGGACYFGADLFAGEGVHQVQDLHRLGLRDAGVGTAIVLDTIEHVRRPWQALEEVARVLAPGGLAVVTSVFFFPIHEHPEDHWRFTDSAVDELLAPFGRRHARVAGPPLLPHTVAGIASNDPVDPVRWSGWCAALDRWVATGATSWKERALHVLPPALLLRGYAGFQRAGVARERRRNRRRRP